MNKIVEKANEINEFGVIPGLEVGDVVTLGEVWDGEGETPEESYSYLLKNEDENNSQVWINYEFEIVEENKNELETIVKITSIDLI